MEVGRHSDGRVLTYDEATASFSLGGEAVTLEQLREHVDAKLLTWDSPGGSTRFEQRWKSEHRSRLVKPKTAVVVIVVALVFISVEMSVLTRGLPSRSSAPATMVAPRAVQTPTPAKAASPVAKIDVPALLSELRAGGDTQVTDVRVNDTGSGSVLVDVYTTYDAKASVVEDAKGIAFAAASSGEVSEAYPKVAVQVRVWPASRAYYMVRVSGDWTGGRLDSPFDVYINEVLK